MAKCLPLSHTPIIGCFRPTSPTVMQLFLKPYLSIWHWVLEKSTVPWVFQSFQPKWQVYSVIRLASLSGAARSLGPSFLIGVWNESCSLSQSRRLIIPSIQIWIHTNSRVSRALFSFFFFFLFSSSRHRNHNHFPTEEGWWSPLFIFYFKSLMGVSSPYYVHSAIWRFCFHGMLKRLGDISST